MEAAGLGLGVVGVAAQLYVSALRGYELLDAASSVATDMGKFTWRLRTEQIRLKKWGSTWNIGDADRRQEQKISDETYRLVVVTLARLTGVLLDVEKLQGCYGISVVGAGGKRKALMKKIAAAFGRGRPPQIPDLQQNIDALENQSFIGADIQHPDIAQEMVKLGETAAAVKSALPAMAKIKWAVLDKEKSEKLVLNVREYNDALYQILPLPSKFATLESKINYKAFSVPFPRNTAFTGREDVMEQLHRELMKDEPARVAVHGMGGVGKTQLMVEYVHNNRSHFSSIYWIRASRTTTLRADFAGIALTAGLARDVTGPGMQQAAITKVKDWLDARESGKWLLVFDNGDDVFESALDSEDDRGTPLLKQIVKLLPDRGCSVITTRDKRTLKSKVAKVGIELGLMPEEEAKTLFFDRWQGLDHFRMLGEEQKVAFIVAKLGFLPLAVDQAAAYIHETKISLDEFIARIDSEPEQRLQQSSVDPDQYSTGVAKTWELSIRFIDDKFPVAGQLFRLLAFFDNEAFSQQVMRTGLFRCAKLGDTSRMPMFPDPPEWAKGKFQALEDEQDFGRALDALDALSLARRNAAGEMVWVHELVHQWMRYRMDKTDRFFWGVAAVETIGHAGDFGIMPRNGSTDATFHLLYESAKQIDDIPATQMCSDRTLSVLFEAPDYFITSKKLKKAILSMADAFIAEGGTETCGDLVTLCMIKILYQSDHVSSASEKYSDLWTSTLAVLCNAAALIDWNIPSGPSERMLEQFHDTFQLRDREEESLRFLTTILASIRKQSHRSTADAVKARTGGIHAVIGRLLMEEGEHRSAALILRSAVRLLQETGLTADADVGLQESIEHLADCLGVLGRPQTQQLVAQFRQNAGKKFNNVDALIRALEIDGKRAQAEGLYARKCLHAASVIRKFSSGSSSYASTGYGDAGANLAGSIAANAEWDLGAALLSYRLADYELDVAAWALRDPAAPVPPGRILGWAKWRDTVDELCRCLQEGGAVSADHVKLARDRATELYEKVSVASSRGYWIGLEDVVAREEVVEPLAGARAIIHDQFPVDKVNERVEKLVENVETWLQSLQDGKEDEDAEFYLEIETEMMDEEPFRLVEIMAGDDTARARMEVELRDISQKLTVALG